MRSSIKNVKEEEGDEMSRKRNVIYVQAQKKGTDLMTSFLMTPAGILITLVVMVVILISLILIASWSLPKFIELMMNPLVWGIGIFIGLLSVIAKRGEVSIILSFLSAFMLWIVPTSQALQGIQQSWWADIPIIGGMFSTGTIAFNLPFMIIGLAINFLAFFIISYISALLIGIFAKG